MKKLSAVLLALIMIFTMAACGEAPVDTTKEVSVADKGVLKVSMSPDYFPMEFIDKDKTGQERFAGFDVTLAKYIADEMDLELQILPMDFSAAQAAVTNGKADISISGYSYTPDRANKYLMSISYQAGNNSTNQTIIVGADRAGQFSKAEDFKGLTIAYQKESLQQDLTAEQLSEFCELKGFNDIGTAVEALRAGTVDGVAVAEGYGKLVDSQNQGIALSGFMFDLNAASKDNVILVPQGHAALLTAVNQAVAKASKAGLFDEWYEDAKKLADSDSAYLGTYDAEGNEMSLKK